MATIPTNLNPLSPNGFQFSIKKLPELTYFAQQVALPNISLPNISIETPFSTIQIAGNTLTFEPLSIDFLVDENMSNYLAISDWIIAMGFPETRDQYTSWQNKDNVNISELAKNYSDATLQILDSSNNPIQTITFVDIIPTSLGNMTFLSTSTDVTYVTCNCSFDYSYYKFG